MPTNRPGDRPSVLGILAAIAMLTAARSRPIVATGGFAAPAASLVITRLGR